MAKTKITDWSTTRANNADIDGINIAENCPAGNMNDMGREFMVQFAETNAGTYPVADTWSFADPADLTKIFRFDGGGITTATTRVITIPDRDLTIGSSFQLTPVTLSGTSQNFTIPSWANCVDITLSSASHNAVSESFLLRVGDAGGIESADYLGSLNVAGTLFSLTSSFALSGGVGASTLVHSQASLRKVSSDGLTWNFTMQCGFSSSAGMNWCTGSKSLSAALTTVQILPSSGSMDGGTATVIYW